MTIAIIVMAGMWCLGKTSVMTMVVVDKTTAYLGKETNPTHTFLKSLLFKS